MDINAVILTMLAELKAENVDLREQNAALRAQAESTEVGAGG